MPFEKRRRTAWRDGGQISLGFPSIEEIAQDGVSDGTKMDPDLVGPSGSWEAMEPATCLLMLVSEDTFQLPGGEGISPLFIVANHPFLGVSQ